jgi:toxin ParE1/3/4
MGARARADPGRSSATRVTLPVIVDPAAVMDIAEAAGWYEANGSGLGDAFLRAVDVGLAQIGRMPEAHARVEHDVRRILLGRYPFALYYLVNSDEVAVVACMHVRRDPGLWLRRVESRQDE